MEFGSVGVLRAASRQAQGSACVGMICQLFSSLTEERTVTPARRGWNSNPVAKPPHRTSVPSAIPSSSAYARLAARGAGVGESIFVSLARFPVRGAASWCLFVSQSVRHPSVSSVPDATPPSHWPPRPREQRTLRAKAQGCRSSVRARLGPRRLAPLRSATSVVFGNLSRFQIELNCVFKSRDFGIYRGTARHFIHDFCADCACVVCYLSLRSSYFPIPLFWVFK